MGMNDYEENTLFFFAIALVHPRQQSFNQNASVPLNDIVLCPVRVLLQELTLSRTFACSIPYCNHSASIPRVIISEDGYRS